MAGTEAAPISHSIAPAFRHLHVDIGCELRELPYFECCSRPRVSAVMVQRRGGYVPPDPALISKKYLDYTVKSGQQQ